MTKNKTKIKLHEQPSLIGISLIMSIVALLINILSLIMLFHGRGSIPVPNDNGNNFTGILIGSFTGFFNNSNINSTITLIGFISSLYLCCALLANKFNKTIKVLLIVFSAISITINIFLLSISCNWLFIALLILCSFIILFYFIKIMFNKKEAAHKTNLIKTIICTSFLVLLIFGALYDCTVGYRSIYYNSGLAQENVNTNN